jgi:hypothetical protein
MTILSPLMNRLPPAPNTPAPRAKRPIDSLGRELSGDRALRELLGQFVFPDKVPEPPAEGARNLMPIMLRSTSAARQSRSA